MIQASDRQESHRVIAGKIHKVFRVPVETLRWAGEVVELVVVAALPWPIIAIIFLAPIRIVLR